MPFTARQIKILSAICNRKGKFNVGYEGKRRVIQYYKLGDSINVTREDDGQTSPIWEHNHPFADVLHPFHLTDAEREETTTVAIVARALENPEHARTDEFRDALLKIGVDNEKVEHVKWSWRAFMYCCCGIRMAEKGDLDGAWKMVLRYREMGRNGLCFVEDKYALLNLLLMDKGVDVGANGEEVIRTTWPGEEDGESFIIGEHRVESDWIMGVGSILRTCKGLKRDSAQNIRMLELRDRVPIPLKNIDEYAEYKFITKERAAAEKRRLGANGARKKTARDLRAERRTETRKKALERAAQRRKDAREAALKKTRSKK